MEWTVAATPRTSVALGHYRQWVAYHGENRIGFGRTQFELYDECYRRGLRDDEFVVRSIEPEMPDEIDPAEFINT